MNMHRLLYLSFLFLTTNLYSQCGDSVVVATTQEELYSSEWQNLRQISDTFNSLGNHTAYNYQTWNSGQSSWNSVQYSSMSFDLQGRITDSLVKMNSPLVNKFKFQFVYDGGGMPLSDTVWNWEGSSWQYGYCYYASSCSPALVEHHHDINNHDSVDTYYLYSNGWKLNSRTLSTVDAAGLLMDQVEQNYDTSAGNWTNTRHSILTYNSQGRQTSSLWQSWNPGLSDWTNDGMFTSSYDSIGNLIATEAVSGYDPSLGSNWFYHDYDVYTYDSQNRLISEHQTHVHHSGSDGNTDIFYQYDSQGNLILKDYTRDTDLNYTHQRTFFHYTNTLQAFAGGSKSACSGTPVRMSGDGFGGCGNLHYQWSPAFAFDDPAIKNPTVSLQSPGYVYLTVSDDSGHSSIDSVYIFLRSHPILTLTTSSNVLCPGSSIQLSSDTTGVTVGGWQLFHDNMFVSGTYSSLNWPVNSPGNYSVISYTNGCTDSSNTIQITDAPAVSFTATTSAATCIGCVDAYILLSSVTGAQPLIYSWTPQNGTISGDSIIGLSAGEYIVCADDAIHCNSFCDTIIVNELPTGIKKPSTNLFSTIYPMPVTNEAVLKIDGSEQNLSMQIFDVNGKAIRRMNVHAGNNVFSKENLMAGVYFYFILSEEKTVFSGKLVIE